MCKVLKLASALRDSSRLFLIESIVELADGDSRYALLTADGPGQEYVLTNQIGNMY